jgi:hypothetical protein
MSEGSIRAGIVLLVFSAVLFAAVVAGFNFLSEEAPGRPRPAIREIPPTVAMHLCSAEVQLFIDHERDICFGVYKSEGAGPYTFSVACSEAKTCR